MTRGSRASHKDTVSLAPSLGVGRQLPVLNNVEAGLREQSGDFSVGKAEAAVRVLVAQRLFLMRRKVDDEQTAAGREHPRRLAQRAARIVEKMQNLMHDREVDGVALDRQRIDVALTQLHIVEAGLFETAARDAEHGGGKIDADGAFRLGREQLEHPAGAGPKIEKVAHRLVADDLAHRLFDALLGDVQRADAVPLLGMRGEIAGGVLGARVTHLGESRAIAGEKRVVSLEPADDGARERARLARPATDGRRPRPLRGGARRGQPRQGA